MTDAEDNRVGADAESLGFAPPFKNKLFFFLPGGSVRARRGTTRPRARFYQVGQALVNGIGVMFIMPIPEMPDLAGFATRGEFSPRAIMREWGVTRVAMIRYHVRPDQELMFAALEVDGGDWYDLQHQALNARGCWTGLEFQGRERAKEEELVPKYPCITASFR